MTTWQPFADRLRDELDRLSELSEELLDASQIEYRGDFNRGGGVVIIAPDWAWAEPTDELRRIQMRAVPLLEQWFERYLMLFRDAPSELRQQVEEEYAAVREWLARDGSGWTGWDVPRRIEEAKEMHQERLSKLRAFLDIVAPPATDGRLLAIPDTSALMDVPDFERYPAALGVQTVDLYLIPPVLSELDNLKDQGRTPDVREKARAAGRAIRAVRQGGSLLDGVEIKPGLRIFSRPQEPEFDGLPGRLDRSVPDDRILAAAFELQRERPAAAVVLVTGDINLQTKADLARLPFAETPELS